MSMLAMEIYKHAFEKMDHAAYLLDGDGRLIACSRNLLRFLGLDQIDGDSIYTIMRQQGLWTSQQIQRFQKNDLNAMISGQRSKEEQSIIRDNGSIICFSVVRIPLLTDSGNSIGLMVTLEDITKQKQTDEQLKALKIQLLHANKVLGNANTDSIENKNSSLVKVLLIEDNLLTQKIEKHILMACNCLIDSATTPAEVNELFKPGKYNLVLMDLGLEKGNGYQVTGVLRKMEQGSRHKVPIIALTGSNPNDVGFECDDVEMNGIIQKPLTPQQAQQLIQRYVYHAETEVAGLREFK